MQTPLLRRGSLAAFLALLPCGCMGEVDLAGLDPARPPPESLSAPLEANLVDGTSEIAMKLPVPPGDCNGCHTESGTAGAPGRIFMP